ncbi:MAG: RES family NAD+ phosphorylase [Treponema sp.]|nr:RES family NAD+ phosphorylase [Treponema sp.]
MVDLKIIELYKMNNFMVYLGNNKENKALHDFSLYLEKEKRCNNNFHPVFSYIQKLFECNETTLTSNESLYRARKIKQGDENIINTGNEEDGFYGFNKMNSFVCPTNKAQPNRANFEGVSCLYTAKDDSSVIAEKTAISEIRPFIGKEISISTIRPKRDLKLFDLYFHPQDQYEDIIKSPRSRFWLDIAIRFSIPYEKSNQNEYLLTQCLAEYFRQAGFDGIRYTSTMYEGGQNIAIFNCKHEDDGGNYEICEPICSTTRFIKNIDYSFE